MRRKASLCTQNRATTECPLDEVTKPYNNCTTSSDCTLSGSNNQVTRRLSENHARRSLVVSPITYRIAFLARKGLLKRCEHISHRVSTTLPSFRVERRFQIAVAPAHVSAVAAATVKRSTDNIRVRLPILRRFRPSSPSGQEKFNRESLVVPLYQLTLL